MRCFFYIVCFLTFISPCQIHGQQIKHLGAYDGIKSGAVRAFAKDTLGFMWIGTAQGLNRRRSKLCGYQGRIFRIL